MKNAVSIKETGTTSKWQEDDNCSCMYCQATRYRQSAVKNFSPRKKSAPPLRIVRLIPAGCTELGDKPVRIGRAETDNEIVLRDDLGVSRHHSFIDRCGDDICIEDLGSRQGTQLNGRYVFGKEPLHRGDIIRIGSSVFVVE